MITPAQHIALERRAKGKLVASMSIFGTIGVFVRYIALPSSVIALTRGLIGAGFLLLVMLLKGARPARAAIGRNLRGLIVSGVFLGANWILLFEAYRYTTVATATLCYYLAPIFVVLASPLLLHERLTWQKALCAAGAFAGMVCVSGVLETGPAEASRFAGVLFGLGAAVLYACIVLLNKRMRDISAYDMTIMQLCVSSAVLLPYVLLTERVSPMTACWQTLPLLLVVGVLHTGVAYALYFSSMQTLHAQTVAIFSYIDPIVAVLLSALLLREAMGLSGVVGAVLILTSTLISELLDRPGGKNAGPPAQVE